MATEEHESAPSRPAWFYTQSAAIPLRRRGGTWEALLVTSRSGRRWIVPKGIVEPGLSPEESAENEAWEEAGVRGSLRPEPLGTYRYRKWGGVCAVQVFVLDVESVADTWPEDVLRRRHWYGIEEAAQLVSEADLAAMLRGLESGADRVKRRDRD